MVSFLNAHGKLFTKIGYDLLSILKKLIICFSGTFFRKNAGGQQCNKILMLGVESDAGSARETYH